MRKIYRFAIITLLFMLILQSLTWAFVTNKKPEDVNRVVEKYTPVEPTSPSPEVASPAEEPVVENSPSTDTGQPGSAPEPGESSSSSSGSVPLFTPAETETSDASQGDGKDKGSPLLIIVIVIVAIVGGVGGFIYYQRTKETF